MSLVANRVNRLSHGLQKNNFYRGSIKSQYDTKLIEYGKRIDIYAYRQPQYSHYNPYVLTGEKKMDKVRADSSLVRARQMIYYLVTANIGAHGNYKPVFLTLTYAKNQTNLRAANRDFKYFIYKFRLLSGCDIEYLCVPEFQKRGAVHYHIIMFNLRYTPAQLVEGVWSHGMTNIQTLRNVKDPAAYVSKYLKKGNSDKRLYGQRVYMCSRNLVRPTLSTDDIYNREIYDSMVVTGARAHHQYTLIKGIKS